MNVEISLVHTVVLMGLSKLFMTKYFYKIKEEKNASAVDTTACLCA